MTPMTPTREPSVTAPNEAAKRLWLLFASGVMTKGRDAYRADLAVALRTERLQIVEQIRERLREHDVTMQVTRDELLAILDEVEPVA